MDGRKQAQHFKIRWHEYVDLTIRLWSSSSLQN